MTSEQVLDANLFGEHSYAATTGTDVTCFFFLFLSAYSISELVFDAGVKEGGGEHGSVCYISHIFFPVLI